MFLKQRIIGISIYFLFAVFFFLIMKRSNTKNVKTILFVYTIILSIMGYFYVPSESADLFRIIETMKIFSTYSLQRIIDFSFSTNIPIFYMLIYGIGKTGLYHLLPAIAAFFFYKNSFYLIQDYSKKTNAKALTNALTLFIFMCFGQFLQVVSGIRSLLAFSIVARCAYDEYFNGRKVFKNILLYVIAATLHPAALALTIIHLVVSTVLFSTNSKNKIYKILFILLLLLLGVKYGSSYIDEMFSSANTYLSHDSYSYSWEYLMAFLYLIIIFLSLFSTRTKEKIISNYRKYMYTIIVGTCAFVYVYSIFQRYTVFISIVSIPVLMKSINTAQENKDVKYISALFTLAILILVIACVRGNLSGLKFFI